MKLNSVNQQNKQAFGAAFIKCNRRELSSLPDCSKTQIFKFLSDELHFVPIMECILSAEHPNKRVMISQLTDNVSFRFIDKDPRKEEDMVRTFRNLFGSRKIDTQIVPNTPENAKTIEDISHANENWVILG